jgi:predicted RNase H-like HicB family nuclease
MADTSSRLEFTVLYEPDETGGYVAICPSIPGCYSQGDTLEEAEANIRECILLCLEEMAERGDELPGTRGSFVGHIAVTV